MKRTVTLKNGQIVEIGGKKEYTHAVIGRFTADADEQVIALCGSRANADKRLAALVAGKTFKPIVGGAIVTVDVEQASSIKQLQRDLAALVGM